MRKIGWIIGRPVVCFRKQLGLLPRRELSSALSNDCQVLPYYCVGGCAWSSGRSLAHGDLATVCSRFVGSARPRVCVKSAKGWAFAVPRWASGSV